MGFLNLSAGAPNKEGNIVCSRRNHHVFNYGLSRSGLPYIEPREAPAKALASADLEARHASLNNSDNAAIKKSAWMRSTRMSD